jgi:hypothetical protein
MEAGRPDASFPRRRYSPDEQAVAIWISHFFIALAVIIFMRASSHVWPAKLFLAGEGLILAMFAVLVPTWDRPATFWRRLVRRRKGGGAAAPRDWRRPGFLIAFALAFVVQFAALIPLLGQTGGPIDSPYIQLALAFAVFTQILANEIHTMVIGLAASLIYYWCMLMGFHFGKAPDPPERWVYGAVTTLIVVITVGLAILDRLDSEQGEDSAESA